MAGAVFAEFIAFLDKRVRTGDKDGGVGTCLATKTTCPERGELEERRRGDDTPAATLA